MTTAAPTAPPAVTVLLVEDTPSLQMLYRSVLLQAGYRVLSASTAGEALGFMQDNAVQVVLLDLVLPDRDGLDLMADLRSHNSALHVIVMTAHGSINKAVEAMRAGAQEFLVKPFDEARLLAALESLAPALPPAAAPKRKAATAHPETLPDSGFIGSSPAMAQIHRTIQAVAPSMATVFITGESGTGKELCALAVHEQSPRGRGPFIALNCGAIPQDLLESEVFGHMKGSFTGALSDKPGAATAADGGTLFLDEVCEMALALQTKLLRFLQTSTVTPVGATRPRRVNVRIICATNRDPTEAVRNGQFREDLFYRLYVVPIHMPPLRARECDVIEIAEAALTRFGQEEGKIFTGLTPEARRLFQRLPWPGNVRQVLNVIRNVVVLQDGGAVSPAMLPASLQTDLGAAKALVASESSLALNSLIGLPLAEVERQVIEATLSQVAGSVPKAARILDISPSTLYRKIEGWAKV
jgi:two-component system, repressor protein LuxO